MKYFFVQIKMLQLAIPIFIIKLYPRIKEEGPSMIEPNILFDRNHYQSFGNHNKMQMNREYSMNLSTSQINLKRLQSKHPNQNQELTKAINQKQLTEYKTKTQKQRGYPNHKSLKQYKGEEGEKWGDIRELRWGENRKMEIRVMKPNLIKPTKDINKLNKRRNDRKPCNKQNKHQKFSRYIQTQINLSDLEFKTRIVSPSKNISYLKGLKSVSKERHFLNRSLSKQNKSTYFQSKQHEKMKTDCDDNLWTRMERSISKTKDKISKLNLKPSYCSPAMSEKMLQKLQQIKQIDFISEHLSDLQIEGILNELELMDIAEARWPLLIVDRVYQVMRRKEYK